MTVKVNISDEFVELKAKRTLEGNILILDHEDMDIVLMIESLKCICFAKESASDRVYDSQDRFYRFLARSGVIDKTSIRGGSIFGSMVAKILESKLPGINSIQATIFSISEYMKEEKPYFVDATNYTDDEIDHMLRPEEEFSTEFGEVPHEPTKGAMDPRVRSYGYQYNYSLIREKENK